MGRKEFKLNISNKQQPAKKQKDENSIDVIRADYMDKLRYKNMFIEFLKDRNLYMRLVNFIRTQRAQNIAEQGESKKKAPVKVLSDDELVRRINAQFSVGGYKLACTDLTKVLIAYPEIAKAYMAGQVDLMTVTVEETLNRLEGCASIENLDMAVKVLALQDKLLESKEKRYNGVRISLLASPQTENTVDILMKEMENVKAPDFDQPDEEVEEWNQIQMREEDQRRLEDVRNTDE